MYHPSSCVFMTNKTPSGAEKHHESNEPESSKMTIMFFFLSFFFFIRRASSILLVVYAQNSSILYRAVHNPITFCITSKYRKALVATHSKTMASTLGHHFLHLYSACALQDHLAMTRNLLLKIAELEIQLVSWAYVGPCQYHKYEYT